MTGRKGVKPGAGFTHTLGHFAVAGVAQLPSAQFPAADAEAAEGVAVAAAAVPVAVPVAVPPVNSDFMPLNSSPQVLPPPVPTP